MNRRRFLKYTGVGIAAGAIAIGGATYYLGEKPKLPETVTTTSTSTSEATPTHTPPAIVALTYTPTRVVNNKIYDIRVDVQVSNPARQLPNVQVALEPVVYAHLPSEAFPNEEPKVNTLQPTGLESELLSTSFTNLKGGREYDVKAILADGSSTMDERTLSTEYVREFENIAALDHILVGAQYYPWWWNAGNQSPPGSWWNYNTNRSATMHNPLLGYYDSSDPVVFERHIDWATGHGIDFLMMAWVCPSDYQAQQGEEHQPRIDRNLKENLLKNSYLLSSRSIGIALTYDPLINTVELGRFRTDGAGIDLDETENRETLVSDFNYISQYFVHPAYQKMNGKPIVYIFGAPMFITRGEHSSPARDVFLEIRRELGIFLAGDFGLFLPSDQNASARAKAFVELASSFDAITTYVPFASDPKVNREGYLRKMYSEWRDLKSMGGPNVIPVTSPGFDNKRSKPASASLVIPRSLEYFTGMTKIALDYLDPELRMLFVTSFNEWYEDTAIEPSKEDRFQYLQSLRDTLAGH